MSNKNDDETSVESGLTETQAHILAEIRNNLNITRERLMEKIKVGKTTVYTAISTLKNWGI